ncbi:MAG: hypothetical protein JXB30_17525 [Anaerolineae bacterium]|nr:hypothetical protein [Anaerolineae bacterium]
MSTITGHWKRSRLYRFLLVTASVYATAMLALTIGMHVAGIPQAGLDLSIYLRAAERLLAQESLCRWDELANIAYY